MLLNRLVDIILLLCFIKSIPAVHEKSVRQFGGSNINNGFGSDIPNTGLGQRFGYPAPLGCPLCDSSVYSYCSHKMIHDACCCDFSASPQLRPPQCAYYDCSLLYAKSCYEHALIKNCCCNNPY
ncbi:uncharacterized protein LOC133849163 [Drosophila sulfurigaster albostrigata]|uniref:uncharacterized protein LOC133849163 n=1 Tax=Drosophila sulfurigaster albostrigata TaxID=89887 RepID=UPI002D2198DD|nr:uncharacterized protein LOC133849163 [Drosophila sulfurigaster albostrigata]